jgi:Galactosyltransferase
LLKVTLESYFARCDQPPREVIVIEDSSKDKPEFLEDFIWRQRSLRWVSNGERRGQIFSIDRAYREVQTEFIMHCEDDWLFERGAGPFVAESKAILAGHEEIIQVSLRGDTGWHPLVKAPEYPFLIATPYWRGVWGGIAFNPGLRRVSDYKAIGTYGSRVSFGQTGLQHEEALSKWYLDQGFRMADLGRAICVHIGGGRSRSVEKLPPLPKILVAVPTCFRFDYEEKWEHKGNPEYGKDMHVSGPNDQTQAIRETWGKDIEPFKEHVDLKFFYGRPAEGYPRDPLPDEVFLDCPDSYGSLPLKTVGVCDYVIQNGYKYTYKCDTDTAVYVDKLLMEIMENKFDYAGFRHSEVASGGPGYLLSDHACQIVSTKGRAPRHWAEDVHVSRVLADVGIQPLMLPGHKSGMSAHFFFPGGFDPSKITDDIITMHALFPETMREWHAYTKKLDLVAA